MSISEGSERPKRRGQIMLYASLLIWIGVIFVFSSTQGSMSQTSRIIRPLLELLFPTAPEEILLFYHGIIRKLAHLTEYAVLGFLASRAVAGFYDGKLRGRSYVWAIVLVVLVAILDEMNQSLNPARTGSMIDVLIDLTGGFIATLFYFLYWRQSSGKASI